jgi:hypothetical protein
MRKNDVISLRTRLLVAAGVMALASLQGRAKADTADEPICLPPGPNDRCPGDEAALDMIAEMHPDDCPPVLDEPGAKLVNGECCYEVIFACEPEVVGCYCHIGRPFVIEGRPLEGAAQRVLGWQDARAPRPDMTGLSAEERGLLAAHWARSGAAEYTSIAGLQRFAMDLMVNGAPADLIAAAHRAALDEVRHARLAFSLASAFAGAPIGPAALDLPAAVPIHRSLAELAISTAREGCTTETLSTCLLAEALQRATDPAVTAALAQMRRDEERHAELAYRALSWALSRDPGIAGEVFASLRSAAEQLETGGFSHPAGLERFGLLRPPSAEACRRTAIRMVIEPCCEALLQSVKQPGSGAAPLA